MANPDWVEIFHPETSLTATVHRLSVPQHAKAGWCVKGSPIPDTEPVDTSEPVEPDHEEEEEGF